MIKFQGWKGNFYDAYFGNLENGEWVDINFFHYLWLRMNDKIVRIVKTDR